MSTPDGLESLKSLMRELGENSELIIRYEPNINCLRLIANVKDGLSLVATVQRTVSLSTSKEYKLANLFDELRDMMSPSR